MTKKKGGMSENELAQLSKARGVATFEYNVGMMLVEADVEKTSAALAVLRPGSKRLAEVEKTGITLAKQGFLVGRIKGHTWSVVYDTNSFGVGALVTADAQEVSRALGCRAMEYGNSDTACALGYTLFDKGALLEKMETDEGYEPLKFQSPGLKTNPKSLGDVCEYVEKLFVKLDAYEPGMSFKHIAGYIMHKPGHKISLGGLDEWMERVDYVAMDADAIAIHSKTPEGKKQAKQAKAMGSIFGGDDEEGDEDDE